MLERATDRRRTAIAILEELKLIDRWRRFGDPTICGAVAVDLVVDLDIDLEINCAALRVEDGFSILTECAGRAGVSRARFANELEGPDRGLYYQLRYLANPSDEWKIDMWALPLDHPGPRAQDLVAPLKEALNDGSRARILAIKEGLAASEVSYRSIDVYRAVIEFGVATMGEFMDWNSREGGVGLTHWRPELSGIGG